MPGECPGEIAAGIEIDVLQIFTRTFPANRGFR